jgi:hypothetical protein
MIACSFLPKSESHLAAISTSPSRWSHNTSDPELRRPQPIQIRSPESVDPWSPTLHLRSPVSSRLRRGSGVHLLDMSMACSIGRRWNGRTLRLPPLVMVTLTKRRVYMILFLARPLGVFFFSWGSTCIAQSISGSQIPLEMAPSKSLMDSSRPASRRESGLVETNLRGRALDLTGTSQSCEESVNGHHLSDLDGKTYIRAPYPCCWRGFCSDSKGVLIEKARSGDVAKSQVSEGTAEARRVLMK